MYVKQLVAFACLLVYAMLIAIDNFQWLLHGTSNVHHRDSLVDISETNGINSKGFVAVGEAKVMIEAPPECRSFAASVVGRWVLNLHYDAQNALYNATGLNLWSNCPINGLGVAAQAYEWQPTSCRLQRRLNYERMCSKLSNQTILMVGDSVTQQMFVSAFFLMQEAAGVERVEMHLEPLRRYCNSEWLPLDADEIDERHKNEVYLPKNARLVVQCSLDAPPITIRYVRHDYASLEHRCEPSNEFFQPWYLYTDANIVLLNRGVHFAKDDVFKRDLSATLSFLRTQWPSKHVRIIYRQTSAAIPACARFSSPLSWEEAAWLNSLPEQRLRMPNYGWAAFYRQNMMAKDISSHFENIEFLDVYNMTLMRPDDHYQRPLGGKDCVHFCLPGLPDVWNAILFQILHYTM